MSIENIVMSASKQRSVPIENNSLVANQIDEAVQNISSIQLSTQSQLQKKSNHLTAIQSSNKQNWLVLKRKVSQKAIKIPRHSVNLICSQLHRMNINTKNELVRRYKTLINFLRQDLEIFGDRNEYESCQIFEEAVEAYANAKGLFIRLSNSDRRKFLKIFNTIPSLNRGNAIISNVADDLACSTKGFDRLAEARTSIEWQTQRIQSILDAHRVTAVPHVIIGAGDAGTTLWLEKYRELHGTVHSLLKQKTPPSVLIVGGESFGNWHHDYLLAQPHALIDRSRSSLPHLPISNPSDFMPLEKYQKNPYVNARLLHQANVADLGMTQAPILKNTTVLKIEKMANHVLDWDDSNFPYRIFLQLPAGKHKMIYTSEIEICTGLGPPRNPLLPGLIAADEFRHLSQFDPIKKFTPIIDGNQFILTDSEEHSWGRQIVIYGGGGTATACYRKGFFGADVKTKNPEYRQELQRNSVQIIGKYGFDRAGFGTLVGDVIKTVQSRNEFAQDELANVRSDSNKRLYLSFKSGRKIECDQLVYCTGQEDKRLEAMSTEINSDLNVEFDSANTPLSVCSKDGKVRYFGAAAIAVRPQEFGQATTKWLDRSNVGKDAVAGTMPPSRAQIKKYAFLQNNTLESVNVNIDDPELIAEFLKRAGVEVPTVPKVVEKIVESRKMETYGFSMQTLHQILKRFQIDDRLRIDGHSNLILNS